MTKFTRDFSVYVGIDWANDKHDLCIQQANSDTRKFKIIKHSANTINDWIISLHKQYKGQIAVAVELSKGPIVYALQKYKFVTIHPVNPSMLAQYRKAFSPSGAKDDPTDAELALDLMLNYPKKIKALKMESEPVRKLTYLVEQRRRLVEDRRRFSNRLINTLKQYYPHLLDWFSHRGSGMFCDFITRWPNLQKLKRARADTLRKFFHAYPGRTASCTEQRIVLINQAEPLTLDKAVIESHQLLAVALANQMLVVVEAIKVFDKEISTLFDTLPDAELYKSLPGTGPCLAPRLLVAMGENRSRFTSASEIQMSAGIAPVTERSGQKCWVHWRYQCSKFTRQSFIEWAAKSVHQSYWAGLYYQQQRSKGNTHQSSVRSLAFKWIRVLYRCWKAKEPYNESKYLKALRDRNSPLLFKEKAC
ncbi:MAG: IS110 family transposase [Colwellia sp.]|uniref:IS110 family transposase n=1 Tax=Colwellia sp. TaxID=56799 RepID=UPI001D6901CC|nr:IS110 family transposase [Colwellia sp.]NQY50926.1 IS110 family transposase [Colwellia sp.]